MFFRPTYPNFFAFEAGNRVIIFFLALTIIVGLYSDIINTGNQLKICDFCLFVYLSNFPATWWDFCKIINLCISWIWLYSIMKKTNSKFKLFTLNISRTCRSPSSVTDLDCAVHTPFLILCSMPQSYGVQEIASRSVEWPSFSKNNIRSSEACSTERPLAIVCKAVFAIVKTWAHANNCECSLLWTGLWTDLIAVRNIDFHFLVSSRQMTPEGVIH